MRVSVVPEEIPKLHGVKVIVEHGAGEPSGHPDSDYTKQGASVVSSAADLYGQADLVLKVQPPAPGEAAQFKEGAVLISFLYPISNLDSVISLGHRRATAFAMELMPRISRAQQMDALSSQSMISGYKAAVIAADSLPRLFPMSITAAGTITPAKVLVIGAGVAGLEAISVAKRLGAVVVGYDVRPAAKEQVESLGARFLELKTQAKEAQDKGGYAQAQSEEFYQAQQQLLADAARASDVVITTALVPGRRAPVLVSEEAVRGMRPGSVVVDLAAEQGGNCVLTEPGKTVVKYGVTIHGPINLPSAAAPEASQLYSRNITSFLLTMLREGNLNIDLRDELVRGPLVMDKGNVVHEPTQTALRERGPP